MEKSRIEYNYKSKNILQLWNLIYQLNKKNLNKYSFHCRQFAETLYDFLSGDNQAFEKLSDGMYYPNLDLEIVREGFQTLFKFYQYCYVKYDYDPGLYFCRYENSLYYSNTRKKRLNEMLDNPDEIELKDKWQITKIIQMLFELEKNNRSVFQIDCNLLTETKEETKKREILESKWYKEIEKELTLTYLDLSGNYQKKDCLELLKETKKYEKSDQQMQKYFRKFSQSSNKKTQIYQLKIMLASYYFYNTSRKAMAPLR